MRYDDVLSMIGNTALLDLGALFPEFKGQVFGKAEFMNPGGSLKDRTALRIIQSALISGELKPRLKRLNTPLSACSLSWALPIAIRALIGHRPTARWSASGVHSKMTCSMKRHSTHPNTSKINCCNISITKITKDHIGLSMEKHQLISMKTVPELVDIYRKDNYRLINKPERPGHTVVKLL